MARAGKNAVEEKLKEDVTFFHILAGVATDAMKEDAIKAMKVFVG
jgi:hypothetical protein